MPKKWPVIVLLDDVVFPNSTKELLLEKAHNLGSCQESQDEYDGQVVVVGVKDPKSDDISMNNLLEIGVLCKIISFRELVGENQQRQVRITVEGLNRVKFNDFYGEKKKNQTIWMGSCTLVSTKKFRQAKYVLGILDKDKNLDLSKYKFLVKTIKASNGNLEQVIDQVAGAWPTDQPGIYEFKKSLLCEPDLFKRLEILMSVKRDLDFFSEYKEEDVADIGDKIDKAITKRVSENISRQQKEFYLREKLKVIKDELGDSSSKEVELRKIRQQLKSESYPDHVVKKAEEELQRFEMCSSYSNEATVIRSYLDWLLNLPWMYLSNDEMDLKKVKQILDRNHYGLDKIKDRIIEFLAVKKKSLKENGTIICFVGPPGVGKTSLAQSIAEALNKKFVKVSLGGLYDESELRGHRRTYVASMPGKIIRALRQAKVKNPVFLLDEVDKLSVGYHGDPVHALLEILDPKQNTNFNDHYLEEDFDLSKVMFIATANYDENIPGPLWDRMEIINLRSYTENEKLHIAKGHLIPEVLEQSGVNMDELKFTDDAIMYIIQRYTREAGVRHLKQQIEKIVRKVVKDSLVDGKCISSIGKKEAREYLDYELYDITQKDDQDTPGIVNGMAYTEFGGDLLPIEVNYVSGKGNLSLTGNLKDTMKESASVALAYVRANEEKFGLKDHSLDWNNIDINLHVPTGGVPKDGPSAGVTIATALISSFSGIPVSSKVAMTGEITLRGKVLPIGGLREKIVSAARGGIETIFFPEDNTRNLSDVPEEVKKSVKLIPVKNYSEIYSRLF